MRFLKNILQLLLLMGLIAYLGYVFVAVRGKSNGELCTNMRVVIADSLHAGFITTQGVEKKLMQAGLHPEGRRMDSIDSYRIEEYLLKDPFIQEAVCYKTPGGLVNVLVKQRIPVLRVMADNGQDYYLDEKGYKMKPMGYDADLVVVTGQVDDRFAQKYLVPLGLLIRHDDFWDAQLEQIHVSPSQELTLYTRIGDQPVSAGRPVDMEQKLNNLRTFYAKALPEVGWNRYKEISIAYKNQVVCKK